MQNDKSVTPFIIEHDYKSCIFMLLIYGYYFLSMLPDYLLEWLLFIVFCLLHVFVSFALSIWQCQEKNLQLEQVQQEQKVLEESMQQNSDTALSELEKSTTKCENLEKSQQVCGSLANFCFLTIKASLKHLFFTKYLEPLLFLAFTHL